MNGNSGELKSTFCSLSIHAGCVNANGLIYLAV